LDSDKDEALKKYHRLGLGFEELNAYLFKDSSAEEQKQSEESTKLIEKLIAFCIENWDNEFMHELQDEL
jgi:hypothetical protein